MGRGPSDGGVLELNTSADRKLLQKICVGAEPGHKLLPIRVISPRFS